MAWYLSDSEQMYKVLTERGVSVSKVKDMRSACIGKSNEEIRFWCRPWFTVVMLVASRFSVKY